MKYLVLIFCLLSSAALAANGNGNPSGNPYLSVLTGDVHATGPNSATTIFSIQGVAVSGTTGTGNVVFSAAPTINNLTVTGTCTGCGTGTVTTFSCVTANGVSCSVANATTTPAATFTLSAITPTTVNGLTISSSSGTLTIANLKTLTASNSLTLAGTDGTTMTFPAASDTVAALGTAESFTKGQSAATSTPSISTSTFTPDVNAANNFDIVLVHASCPCTIASPSNVSSRVGQTGIIEVDQSSTGSDTVSWNSIFKFAGAVAPTLSTGASAQDFFSYYIKDSTHVVVSGGVLNAH